MATTTTRIEELLRCFPFLADQPEDLLLRLSSRAQLQSFQQGQPICRTDQPPEQLHLLVEGTVRSVVFSSRLPRGVATQVFTALLENGASEQGARMSAMDNATRNAGEMITKYTTIYNRSRQAAITKELIEIISGAEAL
jgi:ATP synthase F1 gamma subunit